MGDKEEAKSLMKEAGLPVVEGSETVVENIELARVICEQIGYPIIIKARSGGGGKGMRLVRRSGPRVCLYVSQKRSGKCLW